MSKASMIDPYIVVNTWMDPEWVKTAIPITDIRAVIEGVPCSVPGANKVRPQDKDDCLCALVLHSSGFVVVSGPSGGDKESFESLLCLINEVSSQQ